jgi:hypothetical protein
MRLAAASGDPMVTLAEKRGASRSDRQQWPPRQAR